MVAHFYEHLEWYLTILGIQEVQPRHPNLVRRIRVMGLWGSITREVVPTPMDHSTQVTVNCSQGTYSDCDCGLRLEQTVGCINSTTMKL